MKKHWRFYKKISLKYNKSKGYTKINFISPILKKLIDDKELEFDNSSNIVLLTKNNADIIEKTIKDDNDYYPFFSQIFKSFSINDIKNNNNKALFACIREIDRDNSTNVWRYKSNRDAFCKVIDYMAKNTENFWDKLEKGQKNLPDTLVEQGGTKSLSSKICKYLSEELYKKDNYYINDSVIRAVLLFYLDYYKVSHDSIQSINGVGKISYTHLFDLLEQLNYKVKEKHGVELTKNELDHILWYCYKSFKKS